MFYLWKQFPWKGPAVVEAGGEYGRVEGAQDQGVPDQLNLRTKLYTVKYSTVKYSTVQYSTVPHLLGPSI